MVYLIHMKSELDAANLAAMKYMHRFGKTLNIELEQLVTYVIKMTYNVKPHSVVASNWKTLPLTLDQIGYATLECLFHTCSWQMDCVQQHFKSNWKTLPLTLDQIGQNLPHSVVASKGQNLPVYFGQKTQITRLLIWKDVIIEVF